METFSVIGYFLNASVIVQLIMLLLLSFSIVSWTYIFKHAAFLKRVMFSIKSFEHTFWSTQDLSSLYTSHKDKYLTKVGINNIFLAGFKEYMSIANKGQIDDDSSWLHNIQRAMKVAEAHDLDKVGRHLNFLATVGSTSPYIGLFGTVWGIMTSFHALRSVEQATISMVAPGISEALVATALGLFVAIPAVIAYNRFSETAAKIEEKYSNFQNEFVNILFKNKGK